VAQGVTVVTHEHNKPFFGENVGAARTIAPDQLSKSPKPALFETVSDKKVMTDGHPDDRALSHEGHEP